MQKRALITGATGQDGTYLARYLISKGYEIFGIDAPGHATRADMTLVELDLRDHDRLASYLKDTQPDECYHLAAFHRSSAVRTEGNQATDDERASIETNFESVQTILSTLAMVKPSCRVFLAGSCHMFGDATESPQSERTPFAPTNIYGITKTAAMHLGRLYRREKKMHVCTGILYNHESPLRGPDFVTAKIAHAAVEISRGTMERLTLGNLDAQVDWGFAGDYVEAMHAMLQADVAEDFVIGSGELHRVKDFAEIAFARVGLDWAKYVSEDAGVYRPVSSAVYHGDIRAIGERLGWKPGTSFKTLVEMMVDRYLSGSSTV